MVTDRMVIAERVSGVIALSAFVGLTTDDIVGAKHELFSAVMRSIILPSLFDDNFVDLDALFSGNKVKQAQNGIVKVFAEASDDLSKEVRTEKTPDEIGQMTKDVSYYAYLSGLATNQLVLEKKAKGEWDFNTEEEIMATILSRAIFLAYCAVVVGLTSEENAYLSMATERSKELIKSFMFDNDESLFTQFIKA